MIRQKNGADTLYTLHTSRSSGDLLLTNEELTRVASRRREVAIWLQKPFRGFIKRHGRQDAKVLVPKRPNTPHKTKHKGWDGPGMDSARLGSSIRVRVGTQQDVTNLNGSWVGVGSWVRRR